MFRCPDYACVFVEVVLHHYGRNASLPFVSCDHTNLIMETIHSFAVKAQVAFVVLL